MFKRHAFWAPLPLNVIRMNPVKRTFPFPRCSVLEKSATHGRWFLPRLRPAARQPKICHPRLPGNRYVIPYGRHRIHSVFLEKNPATKAHIYHSGLHPPPLLQRPVSHSPTGPCRSKVKKRKRSKRMRKKEEEGERSGKVVDAMPCGTALLFSAFLLQSKRGRRQDHYALERRSMEI